MPGLENLDTGALLPRSQQKQKYGFTLIDLAVTVVILAVLTAIVLK